MKPKTKKSRALGFDGCPDNYRDTSECQKVFPFNTSLACAKEIVNKCHKMILDKIENANLYKGMHTGIRKALDYLKNTNLTDLATGRYDFEDDSFFVMVFEYETKNAEGNLLESHIKYIDVQYMAEGVEQIGITTFVNQKPTKPYDTDDDYMLFKEPYDLITLNKGMFAIFFPDDLHMPGIKSGSISKVEKIVVKVKM